MSLERRFLDLWIIMQSKIIYIHFLKVGSRLGKGRFLMRDKTADAHTWFGKMIFLQVRV